ncbi:MAG: tetratricopeptide repeat protein [Candidatus Edwardsbacteria bacterium]|nr:tetratricopeptide repeat protein [Candidatus Edwardsbacteria bacterium]
MIPERRAHTLALATVAVACLLCYCNTFHAPFYLDDNLSIVANAALREPGNVGLIWRHSHVRFLGYLSFAFNYWFGGTNVLGYHVTNLAIHVLAALAVYWLALLVFLSPTLGTNTLFMNRRRMALFSALLFVCHPVQTQAVTYIVQRFASLATLFYLLAVCSYLKWRYAQSGGRSAQAWLGWAAGALLFTAAALFTKEIAFTLPLSLIMAELLLVRRDGRIDWRFPATLAAVTAAIGIAIAAWFGLPLRETDTISRASYIFTQFRVILTYLRLLVIPVNQNFDYDYPIYHRLFQVPVLSGLGVILALTALALLLIKRHRPLSFGIFWFFIALSVESSVIPIRDVIFEHRLYLPMAGFALAVACGIDRLLLRASRPLKTAAIAILLGSLSLATFNRNLVWSNGLWLWSDTAAKSPNKSRPHDERGLALARLGLTDRALYEYRTAVRLDPRYSNAWYNLGVTHSRSGQVDSALAAYDRALWAEPRMVMALNNRGELLLRRGALDDAERDFRLALDLNPRQSLPYYNLGKIAYRRGAPLAADSFFCLALARDTLNYWARFGRGVAAQAMSKPDSAVHHFSSAIELVPAAGQFYYMRARAFAALGDTAAASRDHDAASRLGYAPDPAVDWFMKAPLVRRKP